MPPLSTQPIPVNTDGRDRTYDDIPPPVARARLSKQARKAKTLFLANTTLLVVPEILVDQWMGEIEKLVVDGAEGLRVLKVAKGAKLPNIQELICYDVRLERDLSQTKS